MRNENVGDYPPHWPRIARRVKQLNRWRCERCGHPHTSPCDEHCTHPRDSKARVLTVHHLDGDKGNVRLWNLAALCQVCHLQVQARVAFYQTWPFPHTPWMQRHVDRYERCVSRAGRTA